MDKQTEYNTDKEKHKEQSEQDNAAKETNSDNDQAEVQPSIH